MWVTEVTVSSLCAVAEVCMSGPGEGSEGGT